MNDSPTALRAITFAAVACLALGACGTRPGELAAPFR